jgi:hypothetical protein
LPTILLKKRKIAFSLKKKRKQAKEFNSKEKK